MICDREYIDGYADDLVEYAVEFLKANEPDPVCRAETIEAMADVAERHPEAFLKDLLRALRRWLPDLRREAGLCPECGGELEERRYREAHPYGATVAYEEWASMVCPVHGPVDLEGDI